MSDAPITPSGKHWWAPTMGRMTLRARVATAVIVLALVAVTAVVWNLPTVSSIVNAEADEPTAAELALQQRNAELEGQLQSSRAQADALREVLGDEQAARKKGEETAAQNQAQREAEAAAAAETDQKATSGSSGSSKSSGSSSRSGRGGSAAAAGTGGSGSGSGGSGGGSGAANPSAPRPDDPGAPAAPTKPTAPSKAALVNPTSRYFGMYTEQAPFNWATFDDAAEEVGRQQTMVGFFGGWDEAYRANAVTRAWQRGMLPMLTWESRPIASKNDVVEEPDYSLPKIVAGDFDAYLTQYARDVAATGLPLAIRLDHEMNGTWYPWAEQSGSGASINGNNVGDYVKMWQHVHDIFEANGANEYVIWVWAPNIVNNLSSSHQSTEFLRALYPGDAYVDWVGVSGYQRPPYKADNNATFSYTYDRTLDQLRAITDKKILLAEVGASEIGGTKPAWVTSFFQGFDPGRNDDVIGFAWFNLAVTTYVDGQLATNDWRVDSRANSLEAFRAGIADPARAFGGEVLASAPTPAAAAPAAEEPAATAAAAPAPAPAPSVPPAAEGHVPGATGHLPAPLPVPVRAPASGAGWAARLPDGTVVDLDAPLLIGRNPDPQEGVRVVAVADPGRSVSKTHLMLGADEHGPWVVDRGSTNGTLVTLADGQRIVCLPDRRVRLADGSLVAFGDLALAVGLRA
ncbi:FHA domain-containing protein [Cellulomonas sp. ACRRI]|uniref:glycosyl hydrolase n=1 Tax=Cellulomonas sp. ACRRI TaxID=2918188 RepID=UPI001EF24119|nr:glycosyl hydrolase [Cellulomonas sp. ACRRI]MCG7288291.1 FHA domain-containing protein [Cellulomonas sp. ACRRI]